MGLMIGVELHSPDTAKAVVRQLLEQGVIINRTHDTVLRFLPPYIIQKKDVDHVVRLLDRSMAANVGDEKAKKKKKTKGART
jgi:acetylornithine/N-succinyldiaminopimelate aminotransferase